MSPIHSLEHSQASTHLYNSSAETPTSSRLHPQESSAPPPPSSQSESGHTTANDDDNRMSVVSDYYADSGSDSTEHQPEGTGNGLPNQVALKRPPDPNQVLNSVPTKLLTVSINTPQPPPSLALNQPTRTSIPVTPNKDYRDPSYPKNLNDLIDNHSPYKADAKTKVEDVQIDLGKYEGVEDGNNFDYLGGGNQGGRFPRDTNMQTTLPDTADYRQRRPEQLLSHMSSVMKWAGEKDGAGPTEVQFGYVQGSDGKMRIYSSTNDRRSQEWLGNALKDPLTHVKAAAKQNENPDVKRNALKLLYFQENQRSRRSENETAPGRSASDKGKINSDLDLSDELHKQMFTGTHHVVKNGDFNATRYPLDPPPARANEIRRPIVAPQGRHAEQNVAEAMHRDMKNDGGTAEIAGTKVRCYSCSSALGPSLKDKDEQFFISGRAYLAQSDRTSQRELLSGRGALYVNQIMQPPGAPEPDGRGRTRVATTGPKIGDETIRSRSESPARLKPADNTEQSRSEAGPSSSAKRTREDDEVNESNVEKSKKLRI